MTSERGIARLAVLAQLVAVGAWLWPIGFGGRMPVGGDVTQFSLGPMAVYARALREGRLPLWNDLWGYGFPGVGESQMGVYYPPHVVLYGLLTTERAYTASLVLHTLWGALGVFFASRRFGASAVGSALGGFAWSACGFFVIHLPHQWGYTTGSWMPWAWGLGWSVARGEGRRRDPFWLAGVLALQLLPGHFQLAFCTQVGLIVLALEQAVERALTRRRAVGGLTRTFACVLGAFALAGMQVWPTLRLARLAAPRRDFEYLSGFAATPLHLVTFFAPGLFERSPLWRPLVWDPFHTSPEEYLGYVGLVPLCLAFGAVGTGFRRSPAVRALTAVAVVTLLFGLGPYVPGFRTWCTWPGFSFFRAPARWVLATSLALCGLAAVGFDGLSQWRRPGRSLLRFAVAGLVVPSLAVLAVELGLASAGWPWVQGAYEGALHMLPWHEPLVFRRIVLEAGGTNADFRVQEAWARQGVRLRQAPRPVFARQRWSVYREELEGSAVVLSGLVGLAALAGSGRRRLVPAGLVVLTVIDLGYFGRVRRVDFGPIRPLTAQSPVLARLAAMPRGTRTLDTLRNLPMVAGAAPVAAYRTLDLPALDTLTALASRLPRRPEGDRDVFQAVRLTGAGVRVLDPFEGLESERRGVSWPGGLETVHDPALAGWKFGTDWVAQQGPWASTFRLWRPEQPAARAWLVPLTPAREAAILGEWSGDPEPVLSALRDARPLDVRRPGPERRVLTLRADGESLVVSTELADPEWQAVLSGPRGEQAATVERAFGTPNQGAWQAVRVPGPGDWTVTLRYRGRDVAQGLIISAAAVAALAGLAVARGREATGEEGEGR